MSRGKRNWAVAVSLAVAVSVLIPLCLRWRAQWNLDAYRKKLVASGEKLGVAEIAPKKNLQATNTVLYLRLVSTLRPFGEYEPSAMRTVKPGVARVAWREPQLMEKVNLNDRETNVWPPLMGAIRTNEATLDELQTLVDEGGIEFFDDYTQANLRNSDYLGQIRRGVMGLRAKAILALHQGQMQQAFRAMKSSGDVAQLIARDPIIIDQLVRIACTSIAACGCWELLQAGGWSDEQLAQLQHQWEQMDFLTAAEATLAMERARSLMAFQAARASRQGLSDMLAGNTDVKDNSEIWNDFLLNARSAPGELLTAYPRYWGWCWIWSYADEQRYWEFMQTMIETARDAKNSRAILSSPKDRSGRFHHDDSNKRGFDVAGALTGGIERFLDRALREQAVVNIVGTAIALERYHLAHHAYPGVLAELAPEFVRTVPIDCMDGHEIRYRLNPDATYILYSVGEDGVDNGGDPTPRNGKGSSLFSGRDLVWPRPATPEEMEADKAEQRTPKKAR